MENTILERYGRINRTYSSAVETLEEALDLDIETGEHLRMNLSGLDRMIWEEAADIKDGKAFFEHTPSNLTPHHRYGMRLNKKYESGKNGFLAAYCLYFVSGLDKESCSWFEGLCEEQGFNGAFDYIRKLYMELRACDAKDTDVCGKIEEGLPEGSSFHTVDIIEEAQEEDKPNEIYEAYAKRIRRAGKHQIGAIGKELYSVTGLENYLMTMLWNAYKARKAELQKYWKRA